MDTAMKVTATHHVIYHNGSFSDIKAAVTMTVTHFTFGMVIEEQSSPPYTANPNAAFDAMQSVVQTFPTFALTMEAWRGENNDTHFDTAMRIIINGVRAEINA